MKTVRLTMAQALVRFLENQFIEVDGVQTRFVRGMFIIPGHGNVVGLGQALSQEAKHLEVYQGKNEQGMAQAAVAFAKQMKRKQIFAVTSSVGPGAANMVLGEVLNLPGKWSSYPPHHHPQPEVYFYRFDYPDGFGAGFANGEIFKTGHNGCAVINHGFHSQTAAPGYAMCYAWGIRHLDGDPWDKTRIDDPEHAWLWKADANDHIYPTH